MDLTYYAQIFVDFFTTMAHLFARFIVMFISAIVQFIQAYI